MLHMKSFKVAALSALVTVSSYGVAAQQSSMPQEGVAPQEATHLNDMVPAAGQTTAEAIKIDASTGDSFKQSLESIREALPEKEEEQFDKAIETLAEQGDTSLAAEIKNAVTSDDEIVYHKYGSRLDGQNYKTVLNMAG